MSINPVLLHSNEMLHSAGYVSRGREFGSERSVRLKRRRRIAVLLYLEVQWLCPDGTVFFAWRYLAACLT
jgi:hypothetical protein